MLVSYLAQLIMPIYTVMFPRFSQLVAQDALYTLKEMYHRGCQLVSVMILPFAMLLVIFSKDILTLWQLDATTVKNAHMLVSLLAIGMLLNIFIRLPFGLQLAHGWVKLSFYTNLFAAIILVPVIVWLTIEYGVLGGALALIIVNLSKMFVFMHFMHKKILKGELRRWYIQDVGRPLVAVSFVLIGGQLLLPAKLPAPELFVALIGILFLSVLAASIAAPNIWAFIKNQYSLSAQFNE
jgi:O-antigen/teichoic acid export membrane protein